MTHHLIILLLFPIISQAAIISNCVRHFVGVEPARNFCLQCREGFYVKLGSCQQCNKYVKNNECLSAKYMNINNNVSVMPTNTNPYSITNSSISSISSNNKTVQGQSMNTTAINNTNRRIQNNSLLGIVSNMIQNKNLPSNTNIIINNNNNNNSNSISINNSANSNNTNISNTSNTSNISSTNNRNNTNTNTNTNNINNSSISNSRCFVYSEIQNKCMVCQVGYVLVDNTTCTSNHTNSNSTIFDIILATKQLLQSKTQHINKLHIPKTPTGGNTNNQSTVTDTTDYKSTIMQNNNITLDIGDGIISIQMQPQIYNISSVYSNSTGLSNNQSSPAIRNSICVQYNPSKQKTCIRCIQGYIIDTLLHECMPSYHNAVPIPLSTKIYKNITNKLYSSKGYKKSVEGVIKENLTLFAYVGGNQSNTIVGNGNTSIIRQNMNTNMDMNTNTNDSVMNIPIPSSSTSTSPIPIFILPTQTSISVQLPTPTNTNTTTSTGTGTGTNITVPPKPKYTTSIDPRTNKTIMILGTTTNPPNKLYKCIRYREITYTCVQCQPAYTLVGNKCIQATSSINSTIVL